MHSTPAKRSDFLNPQLKWMLTGTLITLIGVLLLGGSGKTILDALSTNGLFIALFTVVILHMQVTFRVLRLLASTVLNLQTPVVLGSLPMPQYHNTGHGPTSSSSSTDTQKPGPEGSGGHYL